MTLIWLCAAFLAGIAAADWFALPMVPALIVAAGSAVFAVIWRGSTAVFTFAIVAAFALGAVRTASVRPVTDASSVWSYVDRRVTITGTVARQPDWTDERQVVVVATDTLTYTQQQRAVHGLVRIQLSPRSELRYGQRVMVTGTLAEAGSNGTFDFHDYLRRQSILAVMYHPSVTIIDSAPLTPISLLARANDALRDTFKQLVPEPHAGLLIGMILGRQSAIADDVYDDFRDTGTSHLLVISGWNISVVAGTMLGLLRYVGLRRRVAAFFTLPVIVAYVIFTGASPAVVRAGIMGALVLVAVLVRRESHAWTSLAFTSAVLALIDPHVLWNIGFQLSVMGTAALLAWSTPIEGMITRRGPEGNWFVAFVARALAPTTAAMVLVTPIIAYNFGTVQTISLLANFVVAPIVPFAMLLGIISVAIGIFIPFLGEFVGWLASFCTWWMVFWTHLFALFPWATIKLPPFSVGWVWAWYAVVGVFEWRRFQAADKRSKAASATTVEGGESAAIQA